MFYRGQKVVCVNDKPGYWGHGRFLRKGAIYTITAIKNEPSRTSPITWTKRPIVQVAELKLAPTEWLNAERFRPIEEKSTETGMAILRGILDGQPIKETIDA